MNPDLEPPAGPPAAGPDESFPSPPPLVQAPPRRRFSRRDKIAASMGVAVVLGLGLGALMTPNTGAHHGPDPDKIETAAASDGDPHLQIQLNKRAPASQALPKSVGKIDAASTVIEPAGGAAPAETAQPPAQARREDGSGHGLLGALGRLFRHSSEADDGAAQAEVQARADVAPPVRAQPSQRREVVVQPAPITPVYPGDDATPSRYAQNASAPWTRPAPTMQPAAARDFSPSFDCSRVRMRSEQAICDDPRLAAADRRMDRAFRQAVRAGASYQALAAEQHRWYRVRERAADDPAALGMIYEQRIAELQQARDQARPQPDGDPGW